MSIPLLIILIPVGIVLAIVVLKLAYILLKILLKATIAFSPVIVWVVVDQTKVLRDISLPPAVSIASLVFVGIVSLWLFKKYFPDADKPRTYSGSKIAYDLKRAEEAEQREKARRYSEDEWKKNMNMRR